MTEREARIAAIQGRCENAQGPPWEAERDDDLMYIRVNGEALALLNDGSGRLVGTDCDAAFIVHAREDIPWLLAHLQAAERDRDAARERIERAVAWAREQSEKYDTFVRRNGGQVVKPNDFDNFVAVLTTPTPPPEEDAR